MESKVGKLCHIFTVDCKVCFMICRVGRMGKVMEIRGDQVASFICPIAFQKTVSKWLLLQLE